MIMYDLPNYQNKYIFFKNTINMPIGNFLNCATCHNLKPSLTIIMDDGDQYLKKTIMSKKIHSATWQILMDGWQLMMSWV